MCVSCQNCVKVVEGSLPEDSPWVHYSCTDMTRFIPHTVESFQDLLESLRAERAAMLPNKQFLIAEQSAGINLDDAVLVQSHMKEIAIVPLSRYVDWFHNIVASGGGVMQYQFNQLLLELNNLGVSPSSVNQFECILPRSHTKLKKTLSMIDLSSIGNT